MNIINSNIHVKITFLIELILLMDTQEFYHLVFK